MKNATIKIECHAVTPHRFDCCKQTIEAIAPLTWRERFRALLGGHVRVTATFDCDGANTSTTAEVVTP